MQGHDGVAAVGGGEGLVVVAGNRVGLTVPFVTVTSRFRNFRSCRKFQHQSHRHHGVATVFSRECNLLRTGSIEGDTVPVVRQLALTDGLGIGHGITGVDGEMQGHHGVAAVGGGEGLVVVAGNRVCLTVPFVTVASRFRDFRRFRIFQHQSHRHHGVAAVGSGQRNLLRASCVESDTVPVVRQFAFADGLGVGHGITGIDGEMQGHDGVAAVDGGEGLVVVARGGVGLTVPLVTVTRSFRNFRRFRIFQHQDHRHDGVATVSSGQGNFLRASCVESDTVPSVRQFAFADGLGVAHRVTRIDGEVQGHDGVAAVDGGEGLLVVAGNRVGLTVPLVTVTSRFRDFRRFRIFQH